MHRIYAANEALNVDAFLQVLTPDVQFYFGSNPPAQGYIAVHGRVSNLFPMLQGLKHTFIDGWERDNTLVFQAHVTYTHKDGRQITLPYVDILQFEGDLVRTIAFMLIQLPYFSSNIGQREIFMQANNNTIAVEQIVRNLVDAWNRHNAKDFAALFAEDGEFTNVVGQRIEGPEEIERVHIIGFSTVLKEATLTIKDVHVRWIRSDIAVIDLR